MSNTIPFKEEAVKNYLDTCIRYWRREGKEAERNDDEDNVLMAKCYIDAFQSVRVSLFGELLPVKEKE